MWKVEVYDGRTHFLDTVDFGCGVANAIRAYLTDKYTDVNISSFGQLPFYIKILEGPLKGDIWTWDIRR